MKSESLVDQTVDCVQTTFVRDGAKDRYKARDRVGLDKYVNFDEPFDNVVCVHFEHLVMPAKIKPSQTHADVTRGKHKMFTKKQRTQQFTTSACTMFRPGGRNSHVDAVPSCSRPFVESLLVTSMFAAAGWFVSSPLEHPTKYHRPKNVIHRRIPDERHQS